MVVILLVVIVYLLMYVSVILDGLVIIVVHQFALTAVFMDIVINLTIVYVKMVGEETTVHNHYVHMFVYMVNAVVLIIVLVLEVGLVITVPNQFVWNNVILQMDIVYNLESVYVNIVGMVYIVMSQRITMKQKVFCAHQQRKKKLKQKLFTIN